MGGLEKNDNDVDCRAISDVFLEKFKFGGEYRAFLKLVEDHRDELVLCFRGNNADFEAVCIYYRNHLVYKIEYKKYKKKYKGREERGKITINFDHARYSEEYEVFWRQINKEYGFNPEAKDVPEIKVTPSVGYKTSDLNENILENVEKIYKNCLCPMLIDSFDPNKTIDYFKNAVSKEIENSREITQTKSKDKWVEKKRQQQLFCAMKSTQNGLFVFDMEFSQPSGLDKKEYGQEIKNQPDMLAIKFNEDGRPINYFLVEVKCKTEACTGKSGLMEHLKAMMKYPEKYKKARRREAALIISQYKELGLYSFFREIDINDYENEKLSVEIMLIFTDEAVSVVSKFKEEFENDTELSGEYKVDLCGDMGIHLPKSERLEIVEIKKKN